MQNRISEEKLDRLLETGIKEFADKGLGNANINVIARNSGISVGTLYNYYGTKEKFFLACLRKSMSLMEEVLKEASSGDIPILQRAEKLIRAIQKYSKDHADDMKMYHEITSGTDSGYAVMFAREIEDITASTYSSFIAQAVERGEIRADIDSRYFAFMFDDLLTMLQFSYCCDYYRERLRIYCGDNVFDDDEKMVREMIKFLESAFTFERSEVRHHE